MAWGRIIIQVEWDAAGTAVDVDRGVVETEPGPELARSRCVISEVFLLPIDIVSSARSGQRTARDSAEHKTDMIKPITCLQERSGELLRADFDHRERALQIAFLFESNQQLDIKISQCHSLSPASFGTGTPGSTATTASHRQRHYLTLRYRGATRFPPLNSGARAWAPIPSPRPMG